MTRHLIAQTMLGSKNRVRNKTHCVLNTSLFVITEDRKFL